MTPEEVETYRKRREQEYLELLSYRAGILKQIEIEEGQIKDLTLAKDNVQKGQRVKELEDLVRDLRQELAEKEKEIDRTAEIRAYKERLKKEFEEVLSHIKLAEIEKGEKEKEISQINQQKKGILESLSAKISEADERIEQADKEIKKIEREKANFLKSLEGREQHIICKSQELAEKETNLAEKTKEQENLKEQYNQSLSQVQEEKKNLEKTSLLTKAKRKDLDSQIANLCKQIEGVKKAEIEIKEISAKLDKDKTKITSQSQALNLEREAIEKTKRQLDERQKGIEQDRKKLEDQQISLKMAFNEAKNKGII